MNEFCFSDEGEKQVNKCGFVCVFVTVKLNFLRKIIDCWLFDSIDNDCVSSNDRRDILIDYLRGDNKKEKQ